jgi:hypothetical protein
MALFCRTVNRHDADIGPAVTGKARKAEAICYETPRQWLNSFGDGPDLTDLAECFSELWKERKKVVPRLHCGSVLSRLAVGYSSTFFCMNHTPPSYNFFYLSYWVERKNQNVLQVSLCIRRQSGKLAARCIDRYIRQRGKT